MTETGWKNLLHHMLTLRKNVFSFIDMVTCYKVCVCVCVCVRACARGARACVLECVKCQ